MPTVTEESTASPVLSAALIRQQLERLVQADLLRSSRRSVAFLRYIVESSLQGRAEELKERTIGVSVFGKALTYDTNTDHVVRTAASELRKRLHLYYGTEEHKDELRILLTPGSYIPHFQPARPALPDRHEEVPKPALAPSQGAEPAEAAASLAVPGEAPLEGIPGADRRPQRRSGRLWLLLASAAAVLILLVCGLVAFSPTKAPAQATSQQLFWAPLLASGGQVLIAVGDVPHGPPVVAGGAQGLTVTPALPGAPTVPFADAVTLARLSGVLAANGKDFLIRRESVSSFADLREHPAVLVGAFNNEWSLRLTRNLRFSLALDPQRHLLYIQDRDHPGARQWQWSTAPHPGERDRSSATPLHDYTLISRLLDSETGHDLLILGGLSTYGTQAAGEFVSSPQLSAVPRPTLADNRHKTLQIVLDTLVVDGSAGPPRVVAVSVE